MGMSKEEFMSRYWTDKNRKERERQRIVNEYFCDRSFKLRREFHRKNRCKISSRVFD